VILLYTVTLSARSLLSIGVLVDVVIVEYVFTQKGASCADVADSIYI